MRMTILLAMMVLSLFISRTYMTDVEGDVRLVDGANKYEGRVEIFTTAFGVGEWGTVCGRAFGSRDASVVCYQVGFDNAGARWIPVSVMYDAYFGENAELPISLAEARCSGVEDKLTMCDGKWGSNATMQTDCEHSQDVGLICSPGNETEGDIRLVGAGVGIESEGRILIVRHNIWGTICHHSWDLQDAKVACRQLGFEFATLATRNSYYGGGNLDEVVMLNNVRCLGTEDHLLDCDSDGWGVEDCLYHEEDSGVICTDEIIEGTLRLVNETSESEGILEIYHAGSWGTICNDESWSDVEALVACRHLGYDTVTSSSISVTPTSDIIQLDAVSCYGYEVTIGNCDHGVWGNPSPSCTHDTDVWLSCENKPVEEGAVRLVGGFTSSEGRVEYYNEDGEWGTICDGTVGDLQIAIVVCRQLGYLTASDAFGQSYFGEGSSDQFIDAVGCNGYEKSFEDCDHNLFGPVECADHQSDAGVVCSDQVNEGDILLVNGSDYTEGRLEIFHDGTWGSICNTNWFGDDASVACNQMGLGKVRYALQDYGPSQGSIHLDNVECDGDEMNVTSCQSGGWGVNDCDHDSDVGLSCFLYDEPVNNEVRLTGGANYREGRVNLYKYTYRVWYSICRDSSWGEEDARVVCNQLELELESENKDFGPGPGLTPRVVYVNCRGTESVLEFCELGYGDDCGSDSAVGVVCKEITVTPLEGEIRLRDGQTFDEGRIEIYHDGVWGFICKTDWGRNEATVACRQLGYDHVREDLIPSSYYILRPVHLDNVRCDGDEESLIECEHDPWGDASCSSLYLVAVACSKTPVPDDMEGWAIALIVIFSVMVAGFGVSAVGYYLYKKKRSS